MNARIYRQERKTDVSSKPPVQRPIAPIRSLRPGAGKPLENKVRERMEGKFGHDFSKVRIHTGGEADRCATGLNSLAYTFGDDVVFADNQFDPNSRSGERLLAHELSHVVQQGGRSMAQDTDVLVSKPGDASEVEAEAAAETVASGG